MPDTDSLLRLVEGVEKEKNDIRRFDPGCMHLGFHFCTSSWILEHIEISVDKTEFSW
jgi:hypothetical protein